jgi:hypothetical protein
VIFGRAPGSAQRRAAARSSDRSWAWSSSRWLYRQASPYSARVEDSPTRWQRARDDSRRFRDWKRDAAVLCLAAGVAFGVMAITGFPGEARVVELIVAGSAVGAVVVLRASELAWNWLKAPMRLLRDDVDALRTEVRELVAIVRPGDLRPALRRVREEARDNLRLLREVQDRNQYWKLTEKAPGTKEWKKAKSTIAADPTLDEIGEKGRHAADEIERILQARSVRTVFKRTRRVEDDDRLPDVVRAVESFESALTTVIGQIEKRK